ncbi:MAG: hypothetical protein HFI41_04395 [Lachnospiraceae bacterium]|nr:hypothetical protein [Lachnospiraceae bacterium]
MQNIQMWVVVIAYLAAIVIIGFIINRRDKNIGMNDYYVSQRSLPPIVIAFSLVATSQSGMVFLGAPGTCYTAGYAQMVWTCMIGGILGIMFCNLALGKPMRYLGERYNSITLTDLLRDIYATKKLQLVCVITLLVVSTFYCVVQWTSIGNLFYALLGVDYKWGVVIGLIVVAVYSALGGNKSSTIVATVQLFIAMLAVLYMFFLALHVGGGLTAINDGIREIDPNMLKLTSDSYSPWKALGFIIIYAVGMIGQPAMATKFFSLKNSKLLGAALALGVISYCFTILNPFAAWVMRIRIEGGTLAALSSVDTVIPKFVEAFANPYIGGLLIAGTLSAIMSTSAALLITVSSTFTNDLCVKMLHKNMSGKSGMAIARIVTLAAAFISGIIALNPPDTVWFIGNAAWGAFAAVFTPALVLGLRWRRATKQGAIASMWAGLILVFGLRAFTYSGIWTWPLQIDMSACILIATFLIHIAVSLATPAQEKEWMPRPKKEILSAHKA